jgi:hypothetical protein
MVFASLGAYYDRMIRLAERIVAGRFVTAKIALTALAVGLFFSFPNYQRLVAEGNRKTWVGILEKSDDPFRDMTTKYEPILHESKLNFRLTVPIAAKLLGLGMTGIFALQSACGVLLLWAAAVIFRRITGDGVAALFLTIGLASTWAGTTGFVELRGGVFDVVALLFLACAVLAEGPLLAGLAVFLAAWTDERGLIASSLVVLYHVYRRYDGVGDRISAFFGPAPTGVVLSWAAYFATRFALAQTYHMRIATAGVNHRTFLNQLNNLPMGCWTALEGGWLLVLAASIVLVKMRQLAFLAAFALSLSIILVFAMSVFDVTRSMAYALPAVFIALEVLRRTESGADLRAICVAASALSFLWPNYYAEINNTIWWYSPLPFRALKWLGG